MPVRSLDVGSWMKKSCGGWWLRLWTSRERRGAPSKYSQDSGPQLSKPRCGERAARPHRTRYQLT